MKGHRATIIFTILFSISLLLLGKIFYGIFFELVTPKLDGAFYQVTEVNGPVWISVLFSFSLALVPFFILLTWQLASITGSNKKLATIFIVIACMAIAIFARRQMIRSHLKLLTANLARQVDQVQVSYPVDNLYFEYSMFGGLCAGCILSYFLFREKKAQRMTVE